MSDRNAVDVDVAIVGAGLSGIGMAAHLQAKCPGLNFTIFERREAVGGTWDLFRYPGIRSDSDMHTLGFEFEPWTDAKSIAGAEAILRYMNDVVDKRGIRERIRFGCRVLSADWDGHSARWRMLVEADDGARSLVCARFLYLGAGYYDHDEPHDALLPGCESFAGEVIHPQFWPEDFDHSGKRVVVIGSGATAVTIVPAMAEAAAHVTMLQRTPTWYAVRPSRDALANNLRRVLPDRLAYALTRFKNIRISDRLFKRMRSRPDRARHALTKGIQAHLGDAWQPEHFTPAYDPWDQRLCMVPDADLFCAIREGKASIVTDRINIIDAGGIRLESGRYLEADVIVTATGLRLAVAGKIALSLNGRPLDVSRHYYYKSCMLSNVPNLVMMFGYLNASWTLRVDLVADYVCRLLGLMGEANADIATPVLAPGDEPAEGELFGMSSGYLTRGRHLLPKSADAMPWKLSQDYCFDARWMNSDPVDDGVLTFDRAAAPHAIAAE